MVDLDDPFEPPPGESGIRPSPGKGRRDARYRPSPDPNTASGDDWREASAHAEPLRERARAVLGTGLNPLVRAAVPLLLLAARLRSTVSVNDISVVLRQVRGEVDHFEAAARTAGVSDKFIVGARYALCANLDEAVLSTPWGPQSHWSSETLLLQLHGEGWGGEKFFDVLARMSADPAQYIDLLEL